jgi:thymidylate synthase
VVHVMRVNNVCQALSQGIQYLTMNGKVEETRGGEALVAPEPVVTVTLQPRQRVLLNSVRDANPFFHLYEAVWMLGGRDDAAPLNSFVHRFGQDYGEPTGEVHGAYGRRWRSGFGFDQIDHIVKTLRRDDKSRQCVLQMWDCTPDDGTRQVKIFVGEKGSSYRIEGVGHDDLRGAWRDRPCNTQVFFRVRGDRGMRDEGHGNVSDYDDRVLDMAVLCRSNDAVWGCHGANAVHFSILQEYVAARVGVEVGVMTQFSWNYHAYVKELERLRQRVPDEAGGCEHLLDLGPHLMTDRYGSLRSEWRVETKDMFDKAYAVDDDVALALAWFDRGPLVTGGLRLPPALNRWFSHSWGLAMGAHALYRAGQYDEALRAAGGIEAPDWRVACVEWLERRKK